MMSRAVPGSKAVPGMVDSVLDGDPQLPGTAPAAAATREAW